jgi:hypothetical protein
MEDFEILKKKRASQFIPDDIDMAEFVIEYLQAIGYSNKLLNPFITKIKIIKGRMNKKNRPTTSSSNSRNSTMNQG